jgi:hypothetical protein
MQLLNYHRNFPVYFGIELTGSAVIEDTESEGEISYHVHNNRTIISVQEITKNNEKFARIFLRDAMGKASFNMKLMSNQNHESIFARSESLAAKIAVRKNDIPNELQRKESSRSVSLIYDNSPEQASVDKIDQLLQQ